MADNSAEAFDACREWLSIDRADLADPMRVLGLPADESDPLRVLRAAEVRLAHLKGLAAGPHHAAREALILRVEQAREAALTMISAGTGGGGSASPYAMPPSPRQARAAEERPPAPLQRTASPASDTMALPRVSARRPPQRRRGNGALWVSGLMVLASVAIFSAFIVWQTTREEARQAAAARLAAKQAAARLAPEGEAPADERPARPRARAATKKPATRSDSTLPPSADAVVSTSRPPRGDAAKRESVAAATRGVAEATAAMDGDGTAPGGQAGADDDAFPADPTADGSDLARDPPADPDSAMVVDMPRNDDVASTGEHSGDGDLAGTPDPVSDTDASDASAEGAGDVDGPVAEALEALHGGDFDRADDLLASALDDAGPIPAKRRVADWQVLARYARDFAGFRGKALDEVRSGNEFDVNGKKVAVVESDENRFVYRFQGKNRACDRDKIPAGIVLAIVTRWFDARPANHLFLGAWHATKPEADLERAREHWETAERGGIDAGPLLRLLDDPALLGAVPSGDDSPEDP